MSVTITIKDAVKKYGETTVIPDLSLTIKEGELFTLLGPSGCGKTTLGRALGAVSSLNFIDLDAHIEAHCHRPIPQVFKEVGEAGFREIEHNMDLMNRSGLTIFMDTSREKLISRLRAGRRKRPLIAGLDDVALEAYVDTTLGQRRPYYEQARAVFTGDLLEDMDQIMLSAERFIESFNLPRR